MDLFWVFQQDVSDIILQGFMMTGLKSKSYTMLIFNMWWYCIDDALQKAISLFLWVYSWKCSFIFTQCWDIFKILSFFHSSIFDSENIYQIRDKTEDFHDTFTCVNYPNNFPVTCSATVNVYLKWDVIFFNAFAALTLVQGNSSV